MIFPNRVLGLTQRKVSKASSKAVNPVRKALRLIPSIRHRHRLKRNPIPKMSKKWMLPAFRKVRHYRYWIQLFLMNQVC